MSGLVRPVNLDGTATWINNLSRLILHATWQLQQPWRHSQKTRLRNTLGHPPLALPSRALVLVMLAALAGTLDLLMVRLV